MRKTLFSKSITVMVIFTVLFATVLLFAFFIVKPNINEAQEEKLLTKRNLVIKEIETQFTQIETVINGLDHQIYVTGGTDDLLDLMILSDQSNDMISSIYLGQPDNTMINSSGFVLPDGFDLTTRAWYQSAIQSHDIIYTKAFLNATEDKFIITVAKAIYDQADQFIGVLGIDVDTQNISSYIESQSEDNGIYGFLIDNNNHVIAHPDLVSESLVIASSQDYDIPTDQFVLNDGMTDELNINDVNGYISYKLIEDTDYIFGLFIPSVEFNQTNTLILWGMIGFLTLGIITGIIIFMILNFFVLRPLNYLIEDINHIDIEKKPDFKLNESQKYGFPKARIALNQLIESSVQSQNMVKEANRELSLSLQKLDLILMSSPDIVFQLDKDFVYRDIYGKIDEILGMKQEDFIGYSFKDVFDQANAEIRETYYHKVMNGSVESYTWFYEQYDRSIYFETSLSPIYDYNSDIVGIVGVTRDITKQENQYRDLLYVSSHDYLTDLYNRKVSFEKLEELYHENACPYTLMNLDVNGLKLINDAFGHEIGDQVLIETANVMKKNIGEDDIASRIGGDEFVIVLPNCDAEKAIEFKQKLIREFSKITVKNYKLSIAIGFSVQFDGSKSIDELQKLAENDMYRHKMLENRSVKNKTISAILKTLTDKYEIEKKHSQRVSSLSYKLGKAIQLEAGELKLLRTAALFHDIGKISIPDEILNKPGKLNDHEYEIIKSHTTIGHDILSAADEYLNLAIYASSHHERVDGKGYPKGLKGDEIPLLSRIICICDAYEAMTSDRPYRKKLTKKKAMQEILDNAGTQFDTELAHIFVEKVLKKSE
jgi:diguanylate cyclase (GGDEF)-like protein/PAS domain S-box-containing protein/putative nucleotidyltransferase with HDIG domain